MSITSIIALVLLIVVGIPSFKMLKEVLERARMLEEQLLAVSSNLNGVQLELEEVKEQLAGRHQVNRMLDEQMSSEANDGEASHRRAG
ncbi:hypothetical protein IQ22_03268 [Pseudomonas duriflava]|uniref:Phage shock protein B n=1 Tax=Pseudomonas duriflava TaxID=459528 RepID=A0A562Q709_9PSED|nr:hypothetical protein [Pseudomonas duriflava]TWI52498.1 hypothetical protein IQ22_03268 [Pseudomonas duriflava]